MTMVHTDAAMEDMDITMIDTAKEAGRNDRIDEMIKAMNRRYRAGIKNTVKHIKCVHCHHYVPVTARTISDYGECPECDGEM